MEITIFSSSGSIAKDRLKLVLVSDRAGCSPEIMEMIKNDIIAVISKYFDVSEEDFDVEIKNTSGSQNSIETRLTANIPIRSIKNIGRNAY